MLSSKASVSNLTLKNVTFQNICFIPLLCHKLMATIIYFTEIEYIVLSLELLMFSSINSALLLLTIESPDVC